MKILICSKYKHYSEWPKIKNTLEEQGHSCTTPMDIDIELFGKSGLELDPEQYLLAVKEYYQKLKETDTLYVLNYDGKVGKSMMQEIGFASALGKEVFSLCDPDGEPSLKLFINKIINPEEI